VKAEAASGRRRMASRAAVEFTTPVEFDVLRKAAGYEATRALASVVPGQGRARQHERRRRRCPSSKER
jgi:hypothetical protein